jgi:hypothetical protein
MKSDPRALKLARPLYGPAHPQGPSQGPDVVSVKRAVSRAFPDIFPWADFNPTYNLRLERAWRTIQHAHGIDSTGQYGTLSHAFLTHQHRADHPHEWAFDAIAMNLMETKWEAIHHPPMPPIEKLKLAMQDFMQRALNSAWNWHYSWQRPMTALGRPPEQKQYSDCSTGATEVIYWGKMVTGIPVPDPNGRSWDGIGNTDTLWATNESRRVHDRYEVGDLALWTAHGGHVAICMEPGSFSSAVFWSNGSESAPNTMYLTQRMGDYRGTVRPILVP